MIRTFIFVAAAALIVAGALGLAGNPGTVVLSGDDWQIGVPLPVFIFSVLLAAALTAFLYRFWRGIRRAPGATRSFLQRRDKAKGYRAITQGMVAIAAGDAQEANKQAKRANSFLDEPPLTMLLSAQAAQLNGDETAAKRYFTAMLESEETAFLGLRGLLMQAQREGQDAEALELARRAHALQPRTPWVSTTLLDLQIAEHHWLGAVDTVDQITKRKAMSPDQARRTKATLMLACSQEAEAKGNSDEAQAQARKAHALVPVYLPASVQLATLLANAGKKRAALKIIEDSWPKTPHPALATLFGGLEGLSDPVKIVQRFEKLANANRDHPESHIALAEALLKAKIWGAARSHLDSAGGDSPSARVCRLMATLEENEHGDMASARAWLLRATYADPDPAWICSDCGSAADSWVPTCSRCGALGSLDWKVPERAGALEAVEPGLILPTDVDGGYDNSKLPVITPGTNVPSAAPSAASTLPTIIPSVGTPVETDASFEPAPGNNASGRGPNP
jgi:HemY protein